MEKLELIEGKIPFTDQEDHEFRKLRSAVASAYTNYRHVVSDNPCIGELEQLIILISRIILLLKLEYNATNGRNFETEEIEILYNRMIQRRDEFEQKKTALISALNN